MAEQENFISLNKLSTGYLQEVQECFKDTGLVIDTERHGKTFSDTTFLDVMIYLGHAILSGIAYDLIKAGIKRIFNKHPNAKVTVRGKDNIIFNINIDLTVNTIVIPDLQKEFEIVKNFDDMIECIKKQIEENTEEK